MSRKSILSQGLAEVLQTTHEAYTAPPRSFLEALLTSPDYRKKKATQQAVGGLVDVAVALLKGSK
jgi:hypothetical protein